MKIKTYGKYALIAAPLILIVVLVLHAGGSVKEPAVAGSFYPADRNTLSELVKGFLSRVEAPAEDGHLIALISPHAGYEYSGQVAAYAYRHLTERKIDTVILIGASHQSAFTGVALYTSGGMRTPLGVVKINSALASALVDDKARVVSYPGAFEKEHSLEVQLPFLQSVLKDFTIVPVLIGQPTRESFDSLTRGLTRVLGKNRNAIIIASTDLSHYHDYATAVSMDRKGTEAVERMSVEDLRQLLSSEEGALCGGYPVLLTMTVARQLGATHGVLYNYANSGDVTNDRSRVVGYAAMGLYKGRLSDEQRKELLRLAKTTIDQYIKRGTRPEYTGKDRRLLANGATFVTINRNNMLRGCIGNIQPVMPLAQSVIGNAVSACSRDPRFPPMTKDELKDMTVEVTVLSPLEVLQDVKDLRIGVHGLFIVKGGNSGILLPQVADEYQWDVPTFLEQVSIKAGLPRDAWKDGQLYSFTADIIRD